MELKVSGKLRVVQYEEETRIIRLVSPIYENTITEAFLERIAQMIGGANNTGQNAVLGIAKFQLGTGTGTTSKDDHALFVPNAASLIRISGMNTTANQTNVIINYPANVISGTFTEAGLLDVNNVLLSHLTMTPNLQVVSNLATTMQYTITVNTQ